MNARSRLISTALMVFAVWAAIVLALAWTGLGQRYSLHPERPADESELPILMLAQTTSALGTLNDYAVVSDRPLFNPDRRPRPSAAGNGSGAVAAVPQALDVLLTSVVVGGSTRTAVILEKKTNKTQVLGLGQALFGEYSAWKLAELEPRRAVFDGPTGRTTLELRKFDGVGGQAPTAPPIVTQSVIQETPNPAPVPPGVPTVDPSADPYASPEARAELIRQRIEERRRLMREEAARANQEQGK